MPRKQARASADTMAARADPFALYQATVQHPPDDVRFLHRVFKDAYGRRPSSLREDFCGTAAVACAWVRSSVDRKAWGVDLDPRPLKWSERFNLPTIPEPARRRLTLLRGDVREVKTPRVDVISAQNFSFYALKERAHLRAYFKNAHRSLRAEGVLVMDIMGGSEMLDESVTETRDFESFLYVWKQTGFDPITHDCRFSISYQFTDGSELTDAFVYNWRLWHIPEVKETLLEAGFQRVEVYWQEVIPAQNLITYRRRRHAPPHPAWLAVLMAVK